MKMEPSYPHPHPHEHHEELINLNKRYFSASKMVQRSNSEPKLNGESEMERLSDRNGSQSMINFPPHRTRGHGGSAIPPTWTTRNHYPEWNRNVPSNSGHKYVQSPILEETESALERELHTGSSYFSRHHQNQNQPFLDYSRYHGVMRNQRMLRTDFHTVDSGRVQGSGAADPPTPPVNARKRSLVMERDLPFFDNRSSYLRRRSSLIRNNKMQQQPPVPVVSNTAGKFGRSVAHDAEETESSSNERSLRNSSRNSMIRTNNSVGPSNHKRLIEDDLDSGIALNNSHVVDSTRRKKFLEKKSIFTIAYDNMATVKIPSALDPSL